VVVNPSAVSANVGSGVGTADPLYVGTAFNGTNANRIEVLAGGSGLTGLSDGMQFVYQVLSNDFIAQVRVASLLPSDAGSKAGLLARPSLTPNDQHLGVFVTPTFTEGGVDSLQAITRATPGSAATVLKSRALFAAPNNWLQLRRTGNTFITSCSSNGVNWIAFATNTPSPAFPAALYVGLATAASANSATAFTHGIYEDFAAVVSSPDRPVFTGAQRLAGGTFRLSVAGPGGATYSIRASTNLLQVPLSAWPVIGVGTCGVSPAVFDDAAAAGYRQRFYRLQSP
jgi:hypothetical protein